MKSVETFLKDPFPWLRETSSELVIFHIAIYALGSNNLQVHKLKIERDLVFQSRQMHIARIIYEMCDQTMITNLQPSSTFLKHVYCQLGK